MLISIILLKFKQSGMAAPVIQFVKATVYC